MRTLFLINQVTAGAVFLAEKKNPGNFPKSGPASVAVANAVIFSITNYTKTEIALSPTVLVIHYLSAVEKSANADLTPSLVVLMPSYHCL